MDSHRDEERKRLAGFTLVEMVMTLVIISIVASVGATSMIGGFNAYLTARDMEPMASNARLALQRMSLELRNAVSCTGISQPGGVGSIQFINDQGRLILVNQGASRTNAIYMKFDADPTEWLLAPNVEANSLQFQITPCTDPIRPGLVSLSFTMATTTTKGDVLRLPVRTSVYVRSTST
ncbi:MAG: prepilin-type N-terminal cleavage/methylation domain-containing protein [Magnetococcales bacterium]|nr:prepilin-type N-terminal cleavage/methylation domain-containing protein [Magnetococcales bacterium]